MKNFESVISKARELGKELQKTESVINLIEAKNENENDEKLQALIGEFNLKKLDLNNEIQKPEDKKDQDRVIKLNDEIKSIYDEVIKNPGMIKFNSANTEIAEAVNHINIILSAAIAGDDIENLDLEQHSCDGSCSSCSGCH